MKEDNQDLICISSPDLEKYIQKYLLIFWKYFMNENNFDLICISFPDCEKNIQKYFQFFWKYFMKENIQDLICISSPDLEKYIPKYFQIFWKYFMKENNKYIPKKIWFFDNISWKRIIKIWFAFPLLTFPSTLTSSGPLSEAISSQIRKSKYRYEKYF